MSQRLFTQRVRQPWELDTDAPEAMRFSPIQWDLYASSWADPSAAGVQQIITGTKGNDALTGTADADVIDGLKGADTMSGAGGDDRYIVDNAKDVVVETASNGIDTVESSVSYKLTENIENLTLTGLAKNGTGNSLNNRLVGNATENVLDGGLGIDTLAGGSGSDTYVVNVAQDVVEELANEGNDTVQSTVNYVLSSQVENLLLLGKGKLTGTGNELANLLTGNLASNTLRGMDGHDTLQGGGGNDTLIGGMGDDTYEIDGLSDIVQETLEEGNDTVRASVSYRLGDHLENLVLTGALSINATGNASANTLTGNAANNLLDGQGGADTLQGGAGDDTYIVDHVGDVLSELDNEGTDTVRSTVSYQLGAALENLTLTGLGSTNATGNAANNVLTGNDAANVLDGGAGADTLVGGNGDDRYVVDSVGDVVTELANGGSDTVSASVSYQLREQVENLVLTGALNINATGNADANVLTGNTGANVLDGGAGADTMTGGMGDDVYGVDNSADVVSELVGEGVDTVRSSISYLLAESLENLELLGSSDLNGTGNSGANRITGNAGANTLDGQGGADTLAGGAGDDSYVVDHVGDVITELADEGTDTVRSTVSYQLGAALENLTLTGLASTNATGNAANNVLTGNAAANVLDGGAGADILVGGDGDDRYVVDDAGDVVTELISSGIDTVSASVSYQLREHVENLVLMGTLNINATGNAVANVLTGNTGANVLDGGAGADTMAGGLGDDVYGVDNSSDLVSELVGEGVDTVRSSISYLLAESLENLELLGSSDLNGTGNGGANRITGNAGANALDGGKGIDTLIGGTGDDSYYVDQKGDQVVEFNAEGIDTVFAKVSYVLATNIEHLTLNGGITAQGNDLSNRLKGNDNNNELLGLAGSDSLYGQAGMDTLDGGDGIDYMAGGSSNDVYIVDNTGDIVEEESGDAGGDDRVEASSHFTLTTNVERLHLTGNQNINGTGNSLANILVGNIASNQLDGQAGDDYLNGQAGNDALLGGDGRDELWGDEEGGEFGHDSLYGGKGEDFLRGWGGNDLLDGGEDQDQLLGGEGLDTLVGGAGNDTLWGDAGDDVMQGGDGADLLYSGQGNDSLYGEAGSDSLFGDIGDDRLDGGSDDDTLSGGLGNDTLIGGDSHDLLLSHDGDDSLSGGSGNDTLEGSTGIDYVDGEAGDDTLYATYSLGEADSLFGGEGRDTLRADWKTASLAVYWVNDPSAVQIVLGNSVLGLEYLMLELGSGNDFVDSPFAVGHDEMHGGVGSDTLKGGAGFDRLWGDSGNDYLDGGSDADDLYGGAGGDTLSGGEGNDQLVGDEGDDRLEGMADQDSLWGGFGNDTLIGGTGLDVLHGEAGNDWLAGGSEDDSLLGGIDNDTLMGDAGADDLSGDDGTDALYGGEGNDRLTDRSFYGPANTADTLDGGLGFDHLYADWISIATPAIWLNDPNKTQVVQGKTIYGIEEMELYLGAGDDSITNLNTEANDYIFAGAGNNTIQSGAGRDTISAGDGIDLLEGGSEDDSLSSTGGADTLLGGEGNDWISHGFGTAYLDGEGGNDHITGGTGAEIIFGRDGQDWLYGGAGNDTIDGGALSDYIYGNAGTDFINAGDGSDNIFEEVIGEAIEGGTIDGGDGFDTLDINWRSVRSSVVFINDSTSSGNTGPLSITGIERLALYLGSGDDQIINRDPLSDDVLAGGAGNDVVDGGGGGDQLYGEDGRDTLFGGDGADELDGGLGDDFLYGGEGGDMFVEQFGTDLMDGGLGNDLFRLGSQSPGQAGIDTLIGGGGVDRLEVHWSGYSEGITFINDPNATVRVADLELLGIESFLISSGSGNDSFSNLKTDGSDTFHTGAGNDSIHSGSGEDTVFCGDGNDYVDAGQGNDTLYGEGGLDRLIGGDGNDVLFEGRSFTPGSDDESDTLEGGAGEDFLFADWSGANTAIVWNVDPGIVQIVYGNNISGIEGFNIKLGARGDTITNTSSSMSNFIDAAAGNDRIELGSGADELFGGLGNDWLKGNDGDDGLYGDAGNDTLIGGYGEDWIEGGEGSDVFVFDSLVGADVLSDFESGADLMRFSATTLPVGDGDKVLEGATVITTPGGFANTAELVICSNSIEGEITVESAASAIGNASSSYGLGQTALFTVNNGQSSSVYLFKSADSNATVSANELTLLCELLGTPKTVVQDYVFVP